MDLAPDDVEPLRDRVRAILRFLRHGPVEPGSGEDLLTPLLRSLLPEGASRRLGRAYEKALRNWPGLRDTPILVLTSLAPGADSIVAEVVLELAETERRWGKGTNLPGCGGLFVKAPLPFPLKLYRRSTTFVRKPGCADAGDASRQDDFDRLVGMIGPDNCFTVDLAEDRGKPWAEVCKSLEDVIQGEARREERRRRQYAAGEYMAVYGHLLLAVWDGRDEQTASGAAAVVRARLSGPRPGVLPNTAELALPHGGPVLHLLARRSKKECTPTLPAMRFVHPYVFVKERSPQATPQPQAPDCAVIAPGQHLDEELQARQLSMLTRIAENLEEFNRESRATQGQENDELEKLLGKDEFKNREPTPEEAALQPAFAAFRRRLEGEHPAFFNGLRLIAAVRRRATQTSRSFEKKYRTTLAALFFLTLATTVLLHVFSDGEAKPAARREFVVGAVIRVVAGGLAFALIVGALAVYYLAARRRRIHVRAHDNRALAEGLRVQFFWCLAGLARSVPASYMQRQRSELDWVRAAVRSVSFHYRRWAIWFGAMPPRDRAIALRCVFQTWIVGEHRYFLDRAKYNERALHSMHRLGALLVMSGVMSFVINWLAVCKFLGDRFTAHAGYLALAGAVLAFLGRPAEEQDEAGHDELWQEPEDGPDPAIGRKRKQYWLGLDRLVLRINPDIRRLLSAVPRGLGVALVMAGACFWVAELAPWLPEPGKLLLIGSGALLVGAALAVAWPEKRLYSESAYQYNTMASLFKHARLRVGADLERLAQEAPGSPEFDESVAGIQEYLYALGKEALDENAEWLLLHRARPLEPMMPG